MLKHISKHPLLFLFLGALTLRLLSYLLLNVFLFHWEFEHPDSSYYHSEALLLLSNWKSSGFYFLHWPEYVNLISLLYFLFSSNPFWPILFNVLASSLVPILAFLTARNLLPSHSKIALLAGSLALIEPYSIYLSTQLLRDSLILSLTSLLLYLATSRHSSLTGWALLGIGMLRYKFAFALSPFLLLLPRRFSLLSSVSFALIILWMFSEGSLVGEVNRISSYEPGQLVEGVRITEFKGEVQPSIEHTEFFVPKASLAPSSIIRLKVPLTTLFVRSLDSFFYPYPWQSDNWVEIFFSSHMLLFYILFSLIFLSSISSLSYLKLAFPFLLLGLFLSVLLTISIPTAGAVTRWRLPVFYFFLLSASLAISFLPSPKRLLDVFLSWAVLILSSPLLLLISILSLPRPLFSQKRIGLEGRAFQLYKFRSMIENSDGRKVENEEDRRITKLGKILRATALDELPELINVIRGDMSLVGPRPHAVWENEEAERDIVGWEGRYKTKPGVMGLAQYKCHRSNLEEKLFWDLKYIEQRNFWFDLRLLWLGVIGSLRRSWI